MHTLFAATKTDFGDFFATVPFLFQWNLSKMVTVQCSHFSKTASLPNSINIAFKHCSLPNMQSSHLSIKASYNWPTGGCLRQVPLYSNVQHYCMRIAWATDSY